MTVQFQVDWRRRSRGGPTYSGHTNVGSMNQCKTVPGRRFPKEMKTVRPTAGQVGALAMNGLSTRRSQFIPNVLWNSTKTIGIVDLDRKKWISLRLVFGFGPDSERMPAEN